MTAKLAILTTDDSESICFQDEILFKPTLT
jgi:hypothetical protein